MWRLTSSEPEIDSLMAVPRSCKSCLIFSSTRSPLQARKLLRDQQLTFTCVRMNYPNGRACGQYSDSGPSGVHYLPSSPRGCKRAATRSGPRAPQLRPVREVLPASPFVVTSKHRRVADLPAAVIRLPHKAAELGVDRDEVVAALHRQQMRGAVRADAGELQVMPEKFLCGNVIPSVERETRTGGDALLDVDNPGTD